MPTKAFDPSRLAPDVLRAMEAMTNMPSFESLPIPQMREAYRLIGANLGGAPLAVGSIREAQIEGAAGSLPLRLYLPNNGDAPYAASIYLHGGGWSIGDIDTHDKVCRRLVHTSGHAVVSVGYRLAPEHPAPAGPDDVVAAVRWLFRHGGELNLNPQRLAVAGDSAGGSLAAVVTQQLRGEVPLRAQVLFYPATDLSPAADNFASRFENGNVPPLTLAAMHAMSNPFVRTFDTADPRLSPLRASNFYGLPPALIFVGECDVLRDDGRHYRDALEKAGVEVEYVEVPGMVHGFIEMAGVLPAAVQAFEQAGTFLRGRL